MTPADYEHYVAEILQVEGWDVRVTPSQGDFGLDIIAERPGRRLGVQVKMYGGGRPVNRQMVTQLSGDALLQDCTEAMLVTDGRLLSDAISAAKKLDIEIRCIPVPNCAANEIGGPLDVDASNELTFDGIWAEHVMALVGEVLERPGGATNQVLAVDWTGLKRRSSTGSVGTIDIEIFRWTIERLLNGHVVLRDEINAQYPKRASSGVVLVLGTLPMFEKVKVGFKQGLRLKHIDERR